MNAYAQETSKINSSRSLKELLVFAINSEKYWPLQNTAVHTYESATFLCSYSKWNFIPFHLIFQSYKKYHILTKWSFILKPIYVKKKFNHIGLSHVKKHSLSDHCNKRRVILHINFLHKIEYLVIWYYLPNRVHFIKWALN